MMHKGKKEREGGRRGKKVHSGVSPKEKEIEHQEKLEEKGLRKEEWTMKTRVQERTGEAERRMQGKRSEENQALSLFRGGCKGSSK